MITCSFEDKNSAFLRHCTVGSILLNNQKDSMLLVRRAEHLLEGGKLALPGGYMDRNETLIETAIREAKEETGYDVVIHNLFRINDNPDRPSEDRQNVDFIFLGQVGEQTAKPDHETTELVWLKLNHPITRGIIAFDHSESIKMYVSYLHKPFPLPIVSGGIVSHNS